MPVEHRGFDHGFILGAGILSIGFRQDDQIREPCALGDDLSHAAKLGHDCFNAIGKLFALQPLADNLFDFDDLILRTL